MNRWLRRLLILAAVVLVGVVLRLTVLRPSPVPVTVTAVERGRVEDTVVNSRAGTIESRRRASISPGVAGLVRAIPVRKGERVREGQPLLRLDASEQEAQVSLQERSLQVARATAEESCLAAEQAARDRARAESLAENDLVSEQDLEQARIADERGRAACQAARERIREADASLAAARAALDRTRIVAPFDGVVLEVSTEVGEWISPSPPGITLPPIMDLIDPDSIYVEAPLDEADVARVREGLPVRITMDAFRGRSFSGRLTYVGSFVETRQEQNRTLPVEAVFLTQELPRNLLPGLSADVEVILEARDDVLRVPTYALLEGDRVLVVRDGRLVSVPVETGLRNWAYVEIRSGLSEGDLVVVSLDRPEIQAGARAVVAERTDR